MALRDQPYFPLYVQDYLSDEKLSLCSPQTQGVYIKMMCIFHKSDVYGGILLNQKDKQKESNRLNFALKFGKLLPFESDIIEAAIDELLDEKVLHIDGDFLYQKRMVHDNEVSIKRSISGKKGGDKSSGNKGEKRSKNLLKQKHKQNTEYEYEYEYEFSSYLKLIPEIWKPVLGEWLDYKKSRRESYKSDKSFLELFNKIRKLSNENIEIATEIVKQSMANNWAGLFELKNNGKNQSSNISGKIDPNDTEIFCN